MINKVVRPIYRFFAFRKFFSVNFRKYLKGGEGANDLEATGGELLA